MLRRINLNFDLRAHQYAAYESETRFEVRVWHRRAGKTFHTVGRQLGRALQSNRNDWRAYYLAPTRVQAKGIAWDLLKRWTKAIGCEANESELRVDLPNGARIQLLGAENYDALRGRYADDIALDETALIPSTAWSTVLSPMLADRIGRATFVGTPMGQMNLFHELWEEAGQAANDGDPEWSRSCLTYEDTDVLDAKEVRRMQRAMTEAEFNQELRCSWTAALRGAYWSREMAAADAEGRITTVLHDKTLPVYAALDLGMRDAMPVIHYQLAGTELRILLCETFEGTSIPDLVAHWRSHPWRMKRLTLPHDAKVKELGTGKTRDEVFRSLGVATHIAPNQGRDEGIAAVTHAIPNMWFDRAGTQMLREAMCAYRSEYDEVRRVHRLTPVHDWASHYADAMRYLVLGRPASGMGWGDNSHLYDAGL